MNRKIFFAICIVFILFAAACEDDFSLSTIDLNQPVSFSEKVLPILTEECGTAGCHVAGVQTPDLTAANAYNELTQLGYVDTTDAENSLIYKRMISASKPMPPDGKLPDAQINLILAWIKQGAQNN